MGLTYKPERGAVSVNELIESTKELFKKMQIQDVKVFKDYTKTELFDQFYAFHEESIDFERKNSGQVLAFVIRWIGWDMKVSNDQE